MVKTMKTLLALLLLIPNLVRADLNEYKLYLNELDSPIAKVVTCFRMYDILASSVELATYDLILKNQHDKAEKLLGTFYNNKARAIFINKLAERDGLLDILNKSYEVGAEMDYLSKDIQKFISPICVVELNNYMKEFKNLSRDAYDESEIYINNFLDERL